MNTNLQGWGQYDGESAGRNGVGTEMKFRG